MSEIGEEYESEFSNGKNKVTKRQENYLTEKVTIIEKKMGEKDHKDSQLNWKAWI